LERKKSERNCVIGGQRILQLNMKIPFVVWVIIFPCNSTLSILSLIRIYLKFCGPCSLNVERTASSGFQTEGNPFFSVRHAPNPKEP